MDFRGDVVQAQANCPRALNSGDSKPPYSLKAVLDDTQTIELVGSVAVMVVG
jgi:hypothetical protein